MWSAPWRPRREVRKVNKQNPAAGLPGFRNGVSTESRWAQAARPRRCIATRSWPARSPELPEGNRLAIENDVGRRPAVLEDLIVGKAADDDDVELLELRISARRIISKPSIPGMRRSVISRSGDIRPISGDRRCRWKPCAPGAASPTTRTCAHRASGGCGHPRPRGSGGVGWRTRLGLGSAARHRTGAELLDRTDPDPAVAAGGLPAVQLAVFDHLLNSTQRQPQALGCLRGAAIFLFGRFVRDGHGFER